jgi:hypothetical protein
MCVCRILTECTRVLHGISNCALSGFLGERNCQRLQRMRGEWKGGQHRRDRLFRRSSIWCGWRVQSPVPRPAIRRMRRAELYRSRYVLQYPRFTAEVLPTSAIRPSPDTDHRSDILPEGLADNSWAIVQASNFTTLFLLSREQTPPTEQIDVSPRCILPHSVHKGLFLIPTQAWLQRAGQLGTDLSAVVKTDQSNCMFT